MPDRSRTLLVMRHADARPAQDAGGDHERRLSPIGLRQARGRGALVRALAPDLVCCSTARRARETLAELELADATVQVDERIYTADVGSLMLLMAEIGAEVSTMLLVGHLPTVADLTRVLLPEAQRGGIAFPPATVAVLDVPVDWAEVSVGCASLRSLTPSA